MPQNLPDQFPLVGDRSLATVVCGSSGPAMATFLQWDRAVLEHLGGLADYVSLHRYLGNRNGDSADYLAVTNSVDRQIEAVDACTRLASEQRQSAERPALLR